MLEFLLADDLTPAEDLVFDPLDAGELSEVHEIHVWNERGNPSGQAVENVLVLMQTEDPQQPGVFRSSGLPPQDELWGRLKVIGQVNAADPSWTVRPTGWRVAGAYASLLLGRIPPDCAVKIEWAQRPPGTASELTWNWQLTALRDEYSRPLPPAVGRIAPGVLPLAGDPAAFALLSGNAVVASAPADDEVHVEPGLVVLAGEISGFITEDLQLDQNDGAAAALGVGESYPALVTRGLAGANVTKGNKAAAPVEPAAPADEPLLAVVTVHYQAGGVSIIEAADIDTSRAAFGRFHAEPGAGAQLRISAGQAIAGETWRFRDGWFDLDLENDETNWVWILTSGLLDATVEPDPPEEEALLLWEADVAGGVIVELRDRRTYSGRHVVLSLRGATPGSAPNLVDELMVGHELLHLEAVTLRASDNGGGASGETVADLQLDGVTVFVEQATEDLRPRVAFNAGAAALQSTSAAHQVTVLRRGDVLSFTIDALPVGGSPARVELTLLCRLP